MEAKGEAAAGDMGAAEAAVGEGVTGIEIAAGGDAAGAGQTESDEEDEESGEGSASDDEEGEEEKGSDMEATKGKNVRKVHFDATPVKASRGAGSGKGGANEGSGSAGDAPD